MSVPRNFPLFLRSCVFFLCAATLSLVRSQNVDLSLLATAVPDSFEVRAASTGGDLTGLPSAVFTIRWELAAGGEVDDTDLAQACPSFRVMNYTGTVDIAEHRYLTLVLFGERPLGQVGCSVTTAGVAIAGVRIRGLSGCRNVELVQNAYTGLNNFNYYFGVGGSDVTGIITSGALSGGSCGPCDPPVITAASATRPPGCTGATTFQVELGDVVSDCSWYDVVTGAPLSYLPTFTLEHAGVGPFLLVVSNACGSDSLELLAADDPALCEPPQITFAEHVPTPAVMSFVVGASGTCLGKLVVSPDGDGFPVLDGEALVPSAEGPGTYLVIAYNGCGADTVELSVGVPVSCQLPNISAVEATVPPCSGGPVTLSAQAFGPGELYYEWRDPSGGVIGTTPTVTLQSAINGDHTLGVQNACGWDWAVLQVAVDTAGTIGCSTPLILGIATNGAFCSGGTLELQAEVLSSAGCLVRSWSGMNIEPGKGWHATAEDASGMYTLVVENACGADTMSVQAEVIHSSYNYTGICDTASAPVDLFDLVYELPAYVPMGGAWTYEGDPHDGYYTPGEDQGGFYSYYPPGMDCEAVLLELVVTEDLSAGLSSTVSVCSMDAPFDLFDALGGSPDAGGTWSYQGGAALAMYDPAVDAPGNYHYQQGEFGGCFDLATVTVIEIEAQSWFADADGDGYGDPANALEDCDPPLGYVSDATDTCPGVIGRVGDACDDGDPNTSGDVLGEDCNCSGTIHIGMSEQSALGFALWPNPTADGRFFVRSSVPSGQVHLGLFDATGRVVLNMQWPAFAMPSEVRLPGSITAGVYLVQVVTEAGSGHQRLVVER